MKIKIKLIDTGIIPIKKTKGAACFDCFAKTSVVVKAGQTTLIPLGFAVELPKNYEMVIRPRSGLSKAGYFVIEGTIDSDYRGEVHAILYNSTDKDYEIKSGDRCCQLIINKMSKVSFVLRSELTDTERGTNGFGSTGV